MSMLFLFQAEDGIRDVAVTGVQTCALPIWGAQLEQRRTFAGNVFGTLQEQLGGARRDLDLGSVAMSLLDELEQLALGEPPVRDDQLVDVMLAQDARHRVQAAQRA